MIAPPTSLNFAGSGNITQNFIPFAADGLLNHSPCPDTPDEMASHIALNFGPSVSQFCQM